MFLYMETPMGKKYLYIVIIVALLAFSYAAVGLIGVLKNSVDPSFARSFSVSGEGKIVAVPDIAQFSFTVISEGGTDIATLQKKNTENVNAIIDFMKSEGVDEKDIKTESYNLSPRYQYYNCSRPIPLDGGAAIEPCPPPEIVGYSVTQIVLVKAREGNFENIGTLLSGAVEHGANSVSQLWFTIDDPAFLEQQAREEAITKAKEKAKAVARAGGFRLGRLLSLNEGGYSPIYKIETARDSALGIGGASVPTPAIEPGSQEVMITVNLTYEIR